MHDESGMFGGKKKLIRIALTLSNSINENSKIRIANSKDKTNLKVELISIFGTSETIINAKINPDQFLETF